MKISAIAITCTGLLAQALFAARILVQWIMSEKARRSLSPATFWILSLCGSYLFCLYGWLRHDFAIVLGQFISYYIYMWNLRAKGVSLRWPLPVRLALLLTPVAAICLVARDAPRFAADFLRNADVPPALLLFGSAGQIIFTLRFIVQWLHSRRMGESRLPAAFWIISLAGSMTIVSYAILRRDIVLILGQSFGLVSYIRNIILVYNENPRHRRRRLHRGGHGPGPRRPGT